MVSSPKLSIVQKKGQVTIPLDIRQRMGIKEGDRVAFVETEVGVLISPQTVVDTEAFERVEALLEQQGITLEAFLSSPLGFAHKLPVATSVATDEGIQAVEQSFGAFASSPPLPDFKQLRERFIEETAQTVTTQTAPPLS